MSASREPDRGPGPHVYPAPAKLNLFLHVIGRRPDGYHLIQSVMRLIDLADDVSIETRTDGVVVRVNDVAGVPADDDLAIRAARLLQAASGTAAGAAIAIEKRIPMGGGLGGGSSDAATTLLALNRLWRLDWPRQRLAELGAQLGADVPFFIGGTNAFVEGIGERLTPVALPDARYALIHPGVTVPTAVVFGAAELTRDSEILKISDFSRSAIDARTGKATGETVFDGGPFRNDLEPVAAARFDAVREALVWLSRDADGAIGPARMTGSGACVFRAFERAAAAAELLNSLPMGWSGWNVRGLAHHPLRDATD